MNEQFVICEIALKLKELGFDEECFAIYIMNKDEKYELDFYSSRFSKPYGDINYLLSKKFNPHHNNVDYPKDYFDQNYMLLAPLWQQAIDWFRESHNLWITISSKNEHFENEIDFCVVPNCGHVFYKDSIKTYENAREQAILKAIELCQKKLIET